MDITFQAAVVFVSDMAASRRFYEKVLGQEVLMDNGENILYQSGLSIWQAERANRIIFGSEPKERSSPGRDNLELYFETDDLKEAKARLEKSGAVFIQDIHEEPWCQRTLRIADPDGHIIEIAEPMSSVIERFGNAGMTAEEIAGKTSMPFETVCKMLRKSAG